MCSECEYLRVAIIRQNLFSISQISSSRHLKVFVWAHAQQRISEERKNYSWVFPQEAFPPSYSHPPSSHSCFPVHFSTQATPRPAELRTWPSLRQRQTSSRIGVVPSRIFSFNKRLLTCQIAEFFKAVHPSMEQWPPRTPQSSRTSLDSVPALPAGTCYGHLLPWFSWSAALCGILQSTQPY